MLITEFFKDQDIFITGASGFLGKALVEKLLRSCSDIRRIFVLIRPKKGKSPEERWQEVWKTSCFDHLRSEKPHLSAKVIAIAGDCRELGLGISADDLAQIQNVSIIYHVAANVRFDDSLCDAILMNTRGTHELIKIALNMQQIKAFVHVSTTYTNVDRYDVEEKVYSSPVDWRLAIKLAETYEPDSLQGFTAKYLGKHPNTYTFSKNLSEQIINEYRHKIPAFIFRPAIIVSSIEEPAPGWIDNFNGSIGLYVAGGLGIIRSSYCRPEAIPSYIPVDVVVRSLIVASYRKAIEGEISSTEQLDVYNCSTDKIINCTSRYITNTTLKGIRNNPFDKTIWVPNAGLYRYWILHYIRLLLTQIPIAIIADVGLRLSGKKPMLMKLQRRIVYTSNALELFMLNEWHFENKRFEEIEDSVPSSEYETFSFRRFEGLDIDDYIFKTVVGAKQYLLQEPLESSPGAKKRVKVMRILNYLIQIGFALLVFRVLWNFFI